MTQMTGCPSDDQLQLLVCGRLTEDRFDGLFEHVEHCPNCLARLEFMEDIKDPFEKALGEISKHDLEAAEAEISSETQRINSEKLLELVKKELAAKSEEFSLSLPCQLGPYRVGQLIGKGGMGEVYLAEHQRLQRAVALKVIRGYRQNDPEMRARFLAEAAIVGKFDHPNLVRAYEAWEENGCLYLVFEYLDGQPLHKWVTSGAKLTALEATDILLGVTRALAELHKNQMVHRDIKPANIIRLKDGLVKLIDFGLVLQLDNGHETSRLAGTRTYMSPEQIKGEGGIDHRSDIYSAGMVLEFLLKQLPEKDMNAADARLREGLGRIAGRMTLKDPQQRYQSVDLIITDLENQKKIRNSKIDLKYMVLFGLLGVVGFLAAMTWLRDTSVQSKANVAKVKVENHSPQEILIFVADNGRQQKFKLDQTAELELDSGHYRIMLEKPRRRSVIPSEVSLYDRDTVRLKISAPTPPFVLKMATIPAGEFVMGAVEGDTLARPNELPRRKIKFEKPFQMSAYEITVGQFREFIEETNYVTAAERNKNGGWKSTTVTGWGEQSREIKWSTPGYKADENMPVSVVSYDDCLAFCEWLSKRDGIKYRLPTEAEWEYACRAGTTDIYHFEMEKRDEYCWSAWISKGLARPDRVGVRKPNAWGLYDMNGNLREWCMDWFDVKGYSLDPITFPFGPKSGTERVIRGGCFLDLNLYLRSSCRGALKPFHGMNNQGFRVVQESQ